MDIRNTPIEPERFYHLYNRGVNGEIIFKTERNMLFFLEKIKENLLPVSDIYAYCLMPNHFHFLLQIKSEEELKSLDKVQNLDKATNSALGVQNLDKAKTGLHASQNIFSKQFSRVFNSYSQAFNKENNRHGALIESPFKRKLITDENYLRQCIIYIHQNPTFDDFTTYPYSSYTEILSSSETFIKRAEVIELFEDKENFIVCHQKTTNFEF